MSMSYHGNHARAARIAREIVRPFDPSDIEWLISENMKYPEEYHKIYSAVDPDYGSLEKRYHDLFDRIERSTSIEECKRMAGELFSTTITLEDIKLKAWFHVGFAAALRLLGAPPDMHVVHGGAQAKLRGGCAL